MHFVVRPFGGDEARDAAGWVYDPPYDFYNGEPEDSDLFLTLDERGHGYYALDADTYAVFIGYCCYGAEARVSDQPELDGVLDIGIGLRPELTGRGLGSAVLPAILEHGIWRWHPGRLRVAVAEFNQRSIALFRANGFEPAGRRGDADRPFVELVLEVQ